MQCKMYAKVMPLRLKRRHLLPIETKAPARHFVASQGEGGRNKEVPSRVELLYTVLQTVT